MTRRHEPARDVSEPQAGHFKIRMVAKGPWVAARIDRPFGQFWRARINGHESQWHIDPAQAPNVYRIWTTGVVITAAEYDTLLAKPPASPDLPIRIGTLPPAF